MIFIDTNYFLRFLLNDVPHQHLTAKNLILKGARNEVDLCTSLVVIFEVVWVLRSYYEKNKENILRSLRKILELSFIKISEREYLEKSFFLYEKTNLSFEDCYNLIFAKNFLAEEIATFDRKLIKEFKRLDAL